MPAKITSVVPMQGFEKTLYKIGEVLFTELTEQVSLNNFPDAFEVFIERMTPYDKSEGVMLNITTSSVNFGNFNERTVQGKTDFSIEIYSPLEETEIDAKENIKRFTLHKVVGIIRYILQSTKYATLDLPLGSIGGTYVESIQFFDDYNNQDGANIRMASLIFSVRVQENQKLWDGVALLGNDTKIKLEETNLGHKLTLNT